MAVPANRTCPLFSPSPQITGFRDRRGDYSGFRYSWRAEFDDTRQRDKCFCQLRVKARCLGKRARTPILGQPGERGVLRGIAYCSEEHQQGGARRGNQRHGRQRSLQQQVEILKQQLAQAQRLTALGELVSTTTHEFNNVLMTILNYAKMGMRHKDAATRDKCFEKILASANRAAKITNTVLGMARNRSAGQEPTDLVQAGRGHAAAARTGDEQVPRDGREELPADPAGATSTATRFSRCC